MFRFSEEPRAPVLRTYAPSHVHKQVSRVTRNTPICPVSLLCHRRIPVRPGEPSMPTSRLRNHPWSQRLPEPPRARPRKPRVQRLARNKRCMARNWAMRSWTMVSLLAPNCSASWQWRPSSRASRSATSSRLIPRSCKCLIKRRRRACVSSYRRRRDPPYPADAAGCHLHRWRIACAPESLGCHAVVDFGSLRRVERALAVLVGQCHSNTGQVHCP